jgi:hypothetical protein
MIGADMPIPAEPCLPVAQAITPQQCAKTVLNLDRRQAGTTELVYYIRRFGDSHLAQIPGRRLLGVIRVDLSVRWRLPLQLCYRTCG